MQINPKVTGPLGLDITRASQPAESADSDALHSIALVPSSSDRSGKVSISDAGRALSARDGGTDSAALDPARAARVRDRVLNGAYDTLEVVDAVARRLLDTGDL